MWGRVSGNRETREKPCLTERCRVTWAEAGTLGLARHGGVKTREKPWSIISYR